MKRKRPSNKKHARSISLGEATGGDELYNIPLSAIRGSDLPTRADTGGWLQFIDDDAKQGAELQEVTAQQGAQAQAFGQQVSAAIGSGSSKGGLTAELEAEAKFVAVTQSFPDFKAGDTIRVAYKVALGPEDRVEDFEGVCISRRNGSDTAASFTVRKISFGEGVEMVFPLHSENIASITIVRRGRVRRAKLYYLRSRRGKATRTVGNAAPGPKRPIKS